MKTKKVKKSIDVVRGQTPAGKADPLKKRLILGGANPWTDNWPGP